MSNTENTVYVGNVDSKVTRELLFELFVQVAPVYKIRYPKDKVLQTHQGYAFVQFYTAEDAQYAAQILNGAVALYDRTLKVRLTTAAQQKISSNNIDVLPIAKIFVKNLDVSIDEAHLTKVFTKFGPLARPPKIFHLSQGQLRCAYIYYKAYEDSDKAIGTLNNQIMVNQNIQLDYAFKKSARGNAKYGEEIDRLLNREAKKNGLL